MSVYTDPTQTTQGSVDSCSVDGTLYSSEDAVIVQVICTNAATLAAGHSVGDSVDAATAQAIARAVLDALAVFSP
tara:strand:+ start:573 stop:797 length:225 start_codon:yes stop_codon:yes gene_type:complete